MHISIEEVLNHIYHPSTTFKHTFWPRYFIPEVAEFSLLGCTLADIVTLPTHESEDLLKRIYDGGIMGLHGELAAKGVPAVVEM